MCAQVFFAISKWAFSEIKGSAIFQSTLGCFDKTKTAHKENNQDSRKEISFTKLITVFYTTKQGLKFSNYMENI